MEKAEALKPIEALPTAKPGIMGRVHAVRQNREMGRFAKFLVVGAIGAVIDYSTYTALNALGVFDTVQLTLPFGLIITGLGISGAIGFGLAVTSNFIWNRFWTYPDSRSKSILSQLAIFFSINLAGLVIRIPVLEVLHRPLELLAHTVVPSLSIETTIWLGETGAWGLAVIIVLFWNFFVNRYWTYSDVE